MSNRAERARLPLSSPEGQAGWPDQKEAFRKLIQGFLDRLCSLEHFMKELKEGFSRWFNKRHGRRGTLWQDRYRSVLVEDGEALRTMAAYLDLNPVRAGLADDPKDYPVGVVMPRRWEEASRPAGRFVSFLARRWRAGRPAGGRPIAASC